MYDGPVVQTQDLTVINITREAVVSRQAKVLEQLPADPGQAAGRFQPVQVPPPALVGRSAHSPGLSPGEKILANSDRYIFIAFTFTSWGALRGDPGLSFEACFTSQPGL